MKIDARIPERGMRSNVPQWMRGMISMQKLSMKQVMMRDLLDDLWF